MPTANTTVKTTEGEAWFEQKYIIEQRSGIWKRGITADIFIMFFIFSTAPEKIVMDSICATSIADTKKCDIFVRNTAFQKESLNYRDCSDKSKTAGMKRICDIVLNFVKLIGCYDVHPHGKFYYNIVSNNVKKINIRSGHFCIIMSRKDMYFVFFLREESKNHY